MITWGINALNHDASIAVVDNGQLVFWDRSSFYSSIRFDHFLNRKLINQSLTYGQPDNIVWYERPWLKKTRQLYAGQWLAALDASEIPARYLKELNVPSVPVYYGQHHRSHAAAGFLTSPYDQATVVVLDALGEWESMTIWRGEGTRLTKLWSRSYPNSLGLFYSAFTKLIGYTPVGEEYLLQKDSEQGDSERFYHQVKHYFSGVGKLRYNLHRGVRDWADPQNRQDQQDIAAAVQRVFEEQVIGIMQLAQTLSDSRNLVYMGGCAMNSKCNQLVDALWDQRWTLPVPGDSSSAIGAALDHQQARITWKS
jgi:carbamoyltransferase